MDPLKLQPMRSVPPVKTGELKRNPIHVNQARQISAAIKGEI